MHTRLLNPAFKANVRRLTTFTMFLCVVCFSLAHATTQLNTKRITGLHLAETAEGSRVTVTGDSLLDDYEAFRRGERFYVRIPSADFTSAHPRFQGPGFDDVQVQKVGDGVVISFRLHPGANARVIGAANRLEVIFTSPDRFAANDGATAVRNRLTRNPSVMRSPSRSSSRSASDAAGPMPPGSPDVDTTDSDQNAPPATLTQSRPLANDSRVKTPSTNAAAPTSTPVAGTSPVPTATPYPTTSTYSGTYTPPTYTYSPSPIQPATASGKSFDFQARSRAALQWISANKKVAAGVGTVGLGLIGVVLFLLYRRRRNNRAMMAKAARVQPKYSSGDDLQDVPSTEHLGEIRFAEDDAYERWTEDSTEDFFFEDLSTNVGSEVAYNKVEAAIPSNARGEEAWEYLPEPNPQAYKSRVQEEREVFEL